MADPKNISMEDITDTVGLDATKAHHVELFRYRFSAATTDGTRKMLVWGADTTMLITAILSDTSSPACTVALANLVLNAASEATSHRIAFTHLFVTNTEYERVATIGNLDNTHKVRIELGYALVACLPVLAREALEKIAIGFFKWVKEKRMREVQSVIDVLRDQGNIGSDSTANAQGSKVPKFIPNNDRTTMTPEERSRYIQEMDSQGLTELLSRMTLSNYHMEAVRKEAMAQLSKRAWEQKAQNGNM